MSRLFDGVDDQMVYAMPGSGGPDYTFGTLLVVIRIITTTDGAWLSFIEGETSGAASRFALGRRNDGKQYYANGAAIDSANTVEDADSWMLLAATKATGTVAPTMHKIIISSGVRSSTALGTSFANSTTIANGNVRLGGDDDFANIRLGVAAIFVGTALTTGQLDGIVSAKTTQSIADLSPTWLVDDSDAFATDLTAGTVDRTTLVGTADDADDPAGWVYGLGGGGGVVVKQLAALGVG